MLSNDEIKNLVKEAQGKGVIARCAAMELVRHYRAVLGYRELSK